MKRKLLIVLFASLCYNIGQAQVDTIRYADLRVSDLKPGLQQYLVYFDNPKKENLLGHSLWSRQLNIKKVNNEEMIEIVQTWYNSDTLKNRYVYSLNRKSDFSPIYHYTKNVKGIEAFYFNSKEVGSVDTVKLNARKDFHVPLKTPTLNWELDLETFPLLPFKKVGQRFAINFYHPGDPGGPKYYEYKVIGTEKLVTTNSSPTDCWLLKIEYQENAHAIFWISKSSKEVLKMEEFFQGRYRIKLKLSVALAKKKA